MYLASIRTDGHPMPTPHLRVTLLGEPLVSYCRGGLEDVPMPSRCVLLLAYLLLHRKARLRERIAATLWPDTLDCDARANLRRTLHDLVRALPKSAEPWILMDAKRMFWNPLAPSVCDVEDFDRLSQHENTRAAAVDTYGGDFLAGEEADWVVDIRSRLRERQLEALQALADTCIACGDTGGAANYYRRLLAIDPFREEAFRALLKLRYIHGDRARAVYEYRGFVNRLHAELGVDPMPETVAYYEQMVRGEPSYRGIIGNFREIQPDDLRSEHHRHTDIRDLITAGNT